MLNLTKNGFHLSSDSTPVAFWPYTTIVMNPFITAEYSSGDEWDVLYRSLIELFNEEGIKAHRDNKTVFQLEHMGTTYYIGFKDWKVSLGTEIRADPWIKPITK